MTTFIKDYFNKQDLEELQKDYKYIIKAHDKFLSGWGKAERKQHIQLILCKDEKEKDNILYNLYHDEEFNYINWYPLKNDFFSNILALRNNKSYSLRNDWKR